jgi:flagellar assembly factor FliW
MITVNTKPYGPMEVDDRQRIHFPLGILGFEHLKDYVILDAAQEPFYWLQSMEMVDVAFVLIDPLIFRPDYSIDLDDDELGDMGITQESDLLLFAIVTIPANQREMSANLQGPVVIGKDRHIGRQFIATDPRWKTKHYILEEMETARKDAC